MRMYVYENIDIIIKDHLLHPLWQLITSLPNIISRVVFGIEYFYACFFINYIEPPIS